MEEYEKQAEALARAYEELARTGSLSAASMAKLRAATDNLGEEFKTLDDHLEEAGKQVSAFYKATKRIAGGIVDSAQAIRDNRFSFEALNPAIGTMADTIGATSRGVGTALGGLGSSIATASAAMGNLAGAAIGIGLLGIGNIISFLGTEAAEAGEKFGNLATSELEKLRLSLAQLGSVGGIAAGGLEELYNRSTALGLSNLQFSAAIARNSQDLAFFNTSVEAGAGLLTRLGPALLANRDQLLRLGVSYEEQIDYLTEALSLGQQIGRQDLRTTNQQSQAALEYSYRIQELSRLTGAQVSQIRQTIEMQQRDVRLLAARQVAEEKFGDTLNSAGVRVSDAISNTSAALQNIDPTGLLASGFIDSFFNPASKEAQRLAMATGGASLEIAQQVANGTMTQGEALVALQQATQGFISSIGGAATVGQVAGRGMDNAINDVGLSLLRFNQFVLGSADRIDSLGTEIQKLGTEPEKGLADFVDAQKNLQNAAVNLDKFVRDNLLGTFAGAINTLTDLILQGTKKIIENAPEEVRPRPTTPTPIFDPAELDPMAYNDPSVLRRIPPLTPVAGPRPTPVRSPMPTPEREVEYETPLYNNDPMVASVESSKVLQKQQEQTNQLLRELIETSVSGNRVRRSLLSTATA